MKNPHKLAKKITIDQVNKQIFIDGELFPFHIMPGVEVHGLLDRNAIPTVDLTLYAETIEVIPEVEK